MYPRNGNPTSSRPHLLIEHRLVNVATEDVADSLRKRYGTSENGKIVAEIPRFRDGGDRRFMKRSQLIMTEAPAVAANVTGPECAGVITILPHYPRLFATGTEA